MQALQTLSELPVVLHAVSWYSVARLHCAEHVAHTALLVEVAACSVYSPSGLVLVMKLHMVTFAHSRS